MFWAVWEVLGTAIATAKGEDVTDETRMDNWNNAQGREIAREIEKNLQNERDKRVAEANKEAIEKIRDLNYTPEGVNPSDITDPLHREQLILNETVGKVEKDIQDYIKDMVAEKVKEYMDDGKLIIDPEKDKREYKNIIDDLSAKLDGRDPSWGKGVLEKLLKLTDWLNGGFDWIGDKFNDYFGLNRSGKFHVIVYDPLVLDLDGDRVELIAENNWNGVLFDFNGNGIKTATQWVSSDDGLLVWDRNGNGKIDNGSELFGEDTIKISANDEFSIKQSIYNFQAA